MLNHWSRPSQRMGLRGPPARRRISTRKSPSWLEMVDELDDEDDDEDEEEHEDDDEDIDSSSPPQAHGAWNSCRRRSSSLSMPNAPNPARYREELEDNNRLLIIFTEIARGDGRRPRIITHKLPLKESICSAAPLV